MKEVALPLLRLELLDGQPLELDLADELERIILLAVGFRDPSDVNERLRQEAIEAADEDEFSRAELWASSTLRDAAEAAFYQGSPQARQALYLAENDYVLTLIRSGRASKGMVVARYLLEPVARFIAIEAAPLSEAWCNRVRALWRLGRRWPELADELLYGAELLDPSESAGHLMVLAGLVARGPRDRETAISYAATAGRLAERKGFEGIEAAMAWVHSCHDGKPWPLVPE